MAKRKEVGDELTNDLHHKSGAEWNNNNDAVPAEEKQKKRRIIRAVDPVKKIMSSGGEKHSSFSSIMSWSSFYNTKGETKLLQQHNELSTNLNHHKSDVKWKNNNNNNNNGSNSAVAEFPGEEKPKKRRIIKAVDPVKQIMDSDGEKHSESNLCFFSHNASGATKKSHHQHGVLPPPSLTTSKAVSLSSRSAKAMTTLSSPKRKLILEEATKIKQRSRDLDVAVLQHMKKMPLQADWTPLLDQYLNYNVEMQRWFYDVLDQNKKQDYRESGDDNMKEVHIGKHERPQGDMLPPPAKKAATITFGSTRVVVPVTSTTIASTASGPVAATSAATSTKVAVATPGFIFQPSCASTSHNITSAPAFTTPVSKTGTTKVETVLSDETNVAGGSTAAAVSSRVATPHAVYHNSNASSSSSVTTTPNIATSPVPKTETQETVAVSGDNAGANIGNLGDAAESNNGVAKPLFATNQWNTNTDTTPYCASTPALQSASTTNNETEDTAINKGNDDAVTDINPDPDWTDTHSCKVVIYRYDKDGKPTKFASGLLRLQQEHKSDNAKQRMVLRNAVSGKVVFNVGISSDMSFRTEVTTGSKKTGTTAERVDFFGINFDSNTAEHFTLKANQVDQLSERILEIANN